MSRDELPVYIPNFPRSIIHFMIYILMQYHLECNII